MSNYTERIAKGGFIVLILSLFGSMLGYFLRIYLARNLTVFEFGLFFSVLSFVGIFSIFKDMGFGLSIARKIPQLKAKGQYSRIKSLVRHFFWIQVGLGITIFVFLFILSDYLAMNFFHDQSASLLIKILGAEYIIGFPLFKFTLQGLEKSRLYSSIEPIRILLIFFFLLSITAINAIFVGWGYFSAGLVINIFLGIYLLIIFNKSKNTKVQKKEVDETFRFGLILFAGTLAGVIISYIDVLAITYFKKIEDVALYQAAFPTAQFLWIFSAAIGVVLLPVVAELWALKNRATLNNTISLLFKFLFIFVFPLAAVLIAFPDLALRTLFGTDYVAAASVLQILAFGAIFYNVYSLLNISLIGIGKPAVSTKIFISMTLVAVFLNIFLVPTYGIIGAAVATTVSYFFGLILTMISLKNDIEFKIKLRDAVFILVGGCTSILFTMWIIKPLLQIEPIFAAISSLFIVYFLYLESLFLTKVIKKDDIKVLEKINLPIPKLIINILNKLVRE